MRAGSACLGSNTDRRQVLRRRGEKRRVRTRPSAPKYKEGHRLSLSAALVAAPFRVGAQAKAVLLRRQRS